MELTGISFSNYKAFPERQSIEIRPLTILIGRNSSGKSAVARFPVLLAASLSERAQAPIELDVDGVDLGGSFVDLIHNRRPHGAIEVGASFVDEDGHSLDLSARVQHYDEVRLQVVQEVRFRQAAGNAPVERHLERCSENPLEEPGLYRLNSPGRAKADEFDVSFQGIWPDMAMGTRGAIEKIRAALSRIVYLGPFRESPQRHYRFPGGLPQNVGRAGTLAPALLGADALRRGGSVMKAVSAFYQEHLGGWPLDVVQRGDTFSLVLRNPDEPAVEINLVDAGTGLSQALPIVAQRLFERVTGKRGGLEIVEQPELHLHPGAHGSLADLYIEAAKEPEMRFLIETHSENFLLRLRRRVAEGTLNRDIVRIYWVDDTQRPGSRVVPIEILPNGDVASWPKGVFSEDFEEVKAIRAAQEDRGR